MLSKGPQIIIGGVPLRDLPESEPPLILRQAFENEIWDHGLIYVCLKYITEETVNKALQVKNPLAKFECGYMGEADWEHGVAIVVESHFGIESTIDTMKHEVRHFYDGPHPWREEKGTWNSSSNEGGMSSQGYLFIS